MRRKSVQTRHRWKTLLLPNACDVHDNRESGVNAKYLNLKKVFILTQILSKQSSTSNWMLMQVFLLLQNLAVQCLNRFSSPDVCSKIDATSFSRSYDNSSVSFVNIHFSMTHKGASNQFGLRWSGRPKFQCWFVSQAMSFDLPGQWF